VFKNLVIFRLSPTWSTSLTTIEKKLEPMRFIECSPSQDKSVGWVAPRGHEDGPLIEAVAGQWIMRLMIEVKAVPANVVRRMADERAARIEEAEGRKPGRKEMKDLREETRLSLLPQAFSKFGTIWVWIDRKAQRLVLDAGSDSRADEVVVILNKCLEGLGMVRLQTTQSPAVCMSTWLTEQEGPAGFTVDRETELKAHDDTQAVVRYSKHALDIDEVRGHVQSGKVPTRLALTWNERVSLVLTEKMQIKKLKFLEGVFDTDRTQDKDEQFDSDVAITTAELASLIPDLTEALGGEMI
jgi:recombination associated protein RdgC